MYFTWTQQFILGQMANKYLGRGWGNYEDIDRKALYRAMVRNGAAVTEFEAMAEQFLDFRAMYYNKKK